MKIILAGLSTLLFTGLVLAQAPTSPAKPEVPAATAAPAAADCDSKAVGKDGKPLAGAAKASFVKKCKTDAMSSAKAACDTKAVDKNGKPLAGAAKTSFVKKCVSEAGVK